MSDMKYPICPICGGDLIKGENFPWFYICQSTNWKSDADKICELDDCAASVPVWETLQRTRKALDVAVDAIDVISLKYHKDTPSIFLIKYAQNAKDQITAITKGDNNE